MSEPVDLAVVLETSGGMYEYVKEFKDNSQEIANIFKNQQLKSACVRYNTSEIVPSTTKAFIKIDECMNQIIVPKKSTENDAYSNAFVVKAVNEALSYDWNNSSKKILLVIATNPISPVDNLEDMMKTINEKNIKMCFVNIIDKETKDTDSKLCVELKKGIKHPNFISKEVRTSKSLIETIKFVLSDNKKYCLATFQNDSLPVLILNEFDDHDNYRIWDGQKEGFRQKSDIDESDQKIDPFMEKVLRSSYSRKCELKRNADESAETIIKAHSQMVQEALKFDEKYNIKWIYSDNKKTFTPIFVIQKTSPLVYMDIYGEYNTLTKSTKRWDCPTTKEPKDILSH
eukprot:157314_1